MTTRPRTPPARPGLFDEDDSQLVLKEFTTLCVGATSVERGPPGSDMVTYRVSSLAAGRPVTLLTRLCADGRSYGCWTVEDSRNKPYHLMLNTFDAHQA